MATEEYLKKSKYCIDIKIKCNKITKQNNILINKLKQE